MYSIVLATMLAGGATGPGQWGCSCAGSRYVAAQGCYGYSSYYGCAGCHGTFYAPAVSCTCHGPSCSGCLGTPRVMPIPAAPMVPPAVPTPAPPSPAPGIVPPPTIEPPRAEETVRLTARSSPAASATVTVRLPADATLYVDDVACPLTSAIRSFTTQSLEPGRQYYYVLRTEVVRHGRTQVQSARVQFEAGRRIDVNFTDAIIHSGE